MMLAQLATSKWVAIVLCIDVLFPRETEFTKFVSEEIATDTSRRRRILMPASPRRRARCDRHEARAGNVALMSCCLVRLSNEVWAFLVKLSHYQRAQRELFAVVPLLRAAWIHWLSVVISEAAAKHFFGVLNGTSISDPEPVNFHAPENWAYDKPHPIPPQEKSSPLASVSPLAPQLYHYSIGFPLVWRTIFAILRSPTRL